MAKKPKPKQHATPKSVYSWHDIPIKDIDAFYDAVYDLRDKMLPVDCDGDHVVSLHFTNRQFYYPSAYLDVPYHHSAEDDKRVEHALLSNLNYAIDAYQKFQRMQQIYTEKHKEKSPCQQGKLR